MITKFKIYEESNFEENINFDLDELQPGDYVIIKPWEIYKQIHNLIGEVKYIRWHYDEISVYFPKYGGFHFGESDLLYWSHNKEDLELLVATKNYNL
jgi:hypothetical protein